MVLDAEPDVQVHLYGKTVKAGRKVGHVTASATTSTTRSRGPPGGRLFEKGTTDE